MRPKKICLQNKAIAEDVCSFLTLRGSSVERLCVCVCQVSAIVGEVIPTRSQQTFSQLQNMIADIAVEREYTYYFWGHADVAVLASNASASFSEEVLGCVPCIHHPRIAAT